MTPATNAAIRRPLARLMGVLALLTCAALTLVATAAAAPVTFGSGKLDWGVKDSFRSYIEGPIAQGDIAATGGAARNPDGAFTFPVIGGTYDPDTGHSEVQAEGTVRFRGHETPGGSGNYKLFMTITNPRIVLDGGAGVLRADVKSNDLEGNPHDYPNVALANLVPSGGPGEVAGGLAWPPIAATLSNDGAAAFGSFYPAGTELDPVSPTTIYGVPRLPNPPGGDIDPPAPPKQPTAPVIKVVGKPVTLGAGRVARVATLRCGDANCRVTTPKSVKVKIKRKRYSVRVLAPKSLKAGKRGKLRIRLSKAARKALAGRRTTVKVRVTLTADGRRTTKTIKTTLKAKKAKKRGKRVSLR